MYGDWYNPVVLAVCAIGCVAYTHVRTVYRPRARHVAPRLCNGLGCVRSVLHISYNVLNCVHRKDTTL